MADKLVQGLIERIVDSPLKLQLLLLYCEHRRLEGTAAQIAQRIYCDLWSTHEALRELAADGILSYQAGASDPIYRYNPRPELLESIVRLCQVYNDPLERDGMQQLVRNVAVYAPYRRRGSGAWEQERYGVAA